MQESLNYVLNHSTALVDLTLTNEHFIVKTQGKGLLDKPKVIDILLANLKNFCLVPTIAVQNLVSPASEGDFSYDSEFIFSYQEGEKLKKKRVFVNSRNEKFKELLTNLVRRCPNASLLHLDPTTAQKQIGALSATKTIYILLALLLGVPLIIAIIVIIFKIL